MSMLSAFETLVDCLSPLQGIHTMYNVLMDNLFSSVKLYDDLLQRKIPCKGTTRSDTTGFPSVLKIRGSADKPRQWDTLCAVAVDVSDEKVLALVLIDSWVRCSC